MDRREIKNILSCPQDKTKGYLKIAKVSNIVTDE